MNQTTQNFCKIWESVEDTRAAIRSQVVESRFYGYAQALKTNPQVAALAKDSKEKELANFIKDNNGKLGIPVRLTDLGTRRMAALLCQMYLPSAQVELTQSDLH